MSLPDPNVAEAGLLGALAVLLIATALLRGVWARRGAAVLLLALVSAGWANWFDLGRPKGSLGIVHTHEQYHFYFGSKYLEEVRYDRLYDATIVVLDETVVRARVKRIRDPMSFEMLPIDQVRDRAEDTRARFTDDRWESFTQDMVQYFQTTQRSVKRLVEDHGNTGSPAWATAALVATGTLPMDLPSMKLMALIDPALLLILFLAAWPAVGLRAATAGLVMALAAYKVEAYIGGSILRMDWLFAVGASALLLHRKRYRLAGLLLGYGVATKLFVGAIALMVGLRFLAQALRDRRLAREHVELVLFAFLGLGLSVAISSVVFGGLDIWWDYWTRILVTFEEGYYTNQFSFRDVYLQILHDPSDLFRLQPGRIAATLKKAQLSTPAMWGARAVIVLVLAWVASRHDELTAFAIGWLCVWVLLVTNVYYWNGMLLLGFALARPGPGWGRRLLWLLGGIAMMAAVHGAVIADWNRTEQVWTGKLLIFWLVVLMVVGEVGHALWQRRGSVSPGAAA